LHTDNILVTEQYGFRKGISTENAACRLTDNVFKCINQKCMLEEFSVNLKRLLTESSVSLLAKLHFYGIQEVSEDWYRSHLTYKIQKVEVK
jgi:hypothetical protein